MTGLKISTLQFALIKCFNSATELLHKEPHRTKEIKKRERQYYYFLDKFMERVHKK